MTTITNPHLTVSTLLFMMEKQKASAILLNHMVIEDDLENIVLDPHVSAFPSFIVQYAGFVEVEMVLDMDVKRVLRVSLRQSAMTFEELQKNGEVLPSLTIACERLDESERVRLDALAVEFIKRGKLSDTTRAEEIMAQYADRVVFSPNQYGALNHV